MLQIDSQSDPPDADLDQARMSMRTIPSSGVLGQRFRVGEAGPVADCTFCGIVAGDLPAAHVLDEPGVVGFLDVRPVFPGHVLLVSREHRSTFAELHDDERDALFEAAQRVAAAVEAALGSGGTWVSMNDKVSQSVPHVHVHVIPRTRGDGLRGFYWPRTRYADDAEAEAVASALRAVLARQ